MFEEFDELNDGSGWTPKSAEPAKQEHRQSQPSQNNYSQQGEQSQQRSSGYSNQNNQQNNYRQNNQGGGGYNKQSYGGGGGGNFQRKEDVLQDAYLPVAVYVDKDFTDEAKESLYNIASKLIARKYTVRVYGTDKDFVERVRSLSSQFVEVYLPWRNFNEIDSKHTFNTLTAKDMARQNFSGWDKVPDAVKGILAGQVRMIFGDRNNSISMCLITWSADGASRAPEVTKDTGRASFIIKLAATFGFPVLNISKQSSGPIIERTFGI